MYHKSGCWIRYGAGDSYIRTHRWVPLKNFPDSKPMNVYCTICGEPSHTRFVWPDGLSVVLCHNQCHRQLVTRKYAVIGNYKGWGWNSEVK